MALCGEGKQRGDIVNKEGNNCQMTILIIMIIITALWSQIKLSSSVTLSNTVTEAVGIIINW